jgi:hypothetical protein
MQIRVTRAVLAVAIGLAFVSALPAWSGPSPARAAGPLGQDIPEPPAVDETVLESALIGPDLFEARTCPTGAARGEYVTDGFRLSVRGRCVQDAPSANLPLPAPNVVMQDDELAVEFKVVAGVERAGLNVYARVRDSANLMGVYLSFGPGKIELLRRDAGVNRVLTGRVDLNDLINRTDWNYLALRVRGTEAWLLLNDVPVLYGADVPDQFGGIGIGAVREGSLNDTAESAIVFRRMTLSTLADPDAASTP